MNRRALLRCLATVAVLPLASSLCANVSWSDVETRDVVRPLPYVARWNTGYGKGSAFPDDQLRLIEQGHHLLLSLELPGIDMDPKDPKWRSYYDDALRTAARLRIPIAFSSTQWEKILSEDAGYLKMHEATNPNVMTSEGAVVKKVSPFGAVWPWTDAGKKWTSGSTLQRLQELYPAPPFVLFVSNNEHNKLGWVEAEQDRRFLLSFGRSQSDEQKRRIIGDRWIERYRALIDGMKQGLVSNAWREHSIFIGYEAFGPSFMGRWPGWRDYSLPTIGRIDPWPLAWDGASVSYYLFDWNDITDFRVFSPQIEAMNWVFMLEEVRNAKPDFWFEISTWDGHAPGQSSDKRAAYSRMGQRLTPERYGGLVQFGLWLIRPNGLREYRGYTEELRDTQEFFEPVMSAVDRVHASPILRDFWQHGRLVANRARKHPYQTLVPEEYREVDRWFLLDTSVDPKGQWTLDTELKVFSLAMGMGDAPARRWLVYAHAPRGPLHDVELRIPSYGSIRVDVPVAGTFYLVDEKTKQVTPIQ